MDTQQPLKTFYASIRHGVPVVHSSLQHCKLMFQSAARNYVFYWEPANFFRKKTTESELWSP